MASLNDLNTNQLELAAATIDQLGELEALRRHGFRSSRTWRAVLNGKSYPSKALVGIALGLSSRDLQGGVSQVVPALQRLGVTVTRDGRPVSSLEDLARSAGFGDLWEARTGLELNTRVDDAPAIMFASGTNRVGTIRGIASVGFDVGITARDVHGDNEAALLELAGTDVQVFVDSGAFSEVEFKPWGIEVVNPIDGAGWRAILDTYRRLAVVLGPQLWIVAPDMVGNQRVTLERLTRYREHLGDLANLGANILVPMQRGEDLTQAGFARVVGDLLESIRWTPALPCRKAATSLEEVQAFVDEAKPERVHLLGIGIKNKAAPAYLEAARSTGASVSLDSNVLRNYLGRRNGPGKGPRAYTLGRDVATVLLAGAATAANVAELGVLLALGA